MLSKTGGAKRRWLVAPMLLATIAGAGTSCITVGNVPKGPGTFVITVTKVNGNDPPTADHPLAPNLGASPETWDFTVDAVDESGHPTNFDGYLRVSVRPGSVIDVVDPTTTPPTLMGRNVLMHNGHAQGQVHLSLIYGPTRLLVEDVGYVPAPAGKTPACSDGKDNNGNHLVDFPNDPGCYAADDDSEDGGSFVAAVSAPVNYSLPTLQEINGFGAKTPYNLDAVQARTDMPSQLVVTRVSTSGFYVTDLNDQGKGWNSLYAFNFSAPINMQVCDRVTYLSGTMGVFFGYNELNFPSYRLNPLYVGQEDLCTVPEPTLLDATTISSTPEMKKVQSALVRVQDYVIPKHFGSKLVVNNQPADGASNCDFNGDGKIEFTDAAEGNCSAACDADVDCSEWTEFASRGNYKIHKVNSTIQVNTDTVGQFEPQASPGMPITVAGTLAFFSGGKNNWTIEARCPDDLVCDPNTPGCSAQILDSKHACVHITRTIDDNDSASN